MIYRISSSRDLSGTHIYLTSRYPGENAVNAEKNALSNGFMVSLGSKQVDHPMEDQTILSVSSSFDSMFPLLLTFHHQTLDGYSIPAMIVALYEHKITSPADVIKALRVSSPRQELADPALPYFRRLIRLLVVRYLNGAGHPPAMRGSFVSEEDFVQHQGSHILRPAMFLRAATDSDLPPGDRDWHIEVSF